MELQFGRLNVRLDSPQPRRLETSRAPEHEVTEHQLVRLCGLLFNQAIKQHFSHPDKQYISEIIDERGVAYEYIGLGDHEIGAVLMRPGPDRLEDASFPYQLYQHAIGFDIDSGLPADYGLTHLIDRQGNFHQEIEQKGQRLAVTVDKPTEQRLLRFMLDCQLIDLKK